MTVTQPGGGRLALAVLALATFGYGALETMLAPALPVIQQAVGASTPAIAWVFTSVLIAGAVSTPVISKLADTRNKRGVLLGVLTVVCAGTLVAALATSITVLTIGQFLQGVGMGLVPLSVGITRHTQPSERIRSANGLIIGVGALSSVIGLTVAGPIVARMPYTWLFWFPFGLLAVTLVFAWLVVPSCPPSGVGRVDWAGAVLLGLGLAAVLIAITQSTAWGWSSTKELGLVAVSVLLMAAFFLLELRTREPLVDLRQLSDRAVLLACAVSFVVGFASFVFMLIPLLVQAPASAGYSLGDSVTRAGLYLAPLGLVAAFSAPLAGRFERRIGVRAVMVMGTGAAVVANAVLLVANYSQLIFVSTAVAGFGIGLGLTQAMNIITATVPAERTASISGVVYVIRAVGGALGAQVGTSILASGHAQVPTWAGFRVALLLSTLIGIVAVALSWAIPTRIITTASGNVVRARWENDVEMTRSAGHPH
ncbi:MAG: MFS transporter [Pseudonocardiales bacterium]|nr:MFS transporter [Pseudonocardiales bacterium]